MPLSQFGIELASSFLVIISFCSIFNFITMLCSDIAISTTICTLLFIAMFIASSALGYTLSTATPITHSSYDEQGNRIIVSQEPNPNYPGDNIIKVVKTVYLLLPQSGAEEISNNNIDYVSEMPIYSVCFIAFTNICGIYLFSRKELK